MKHLQIAALIFVLVTVFSVTSYYIGRDSVKNEKPNNQYQLLVNWKYDNQNPNIQLMDGNRLITTFKLGQDTTLENAILDDNY